MSKAAPEPRSQPAETAGSGPASSHDQWLARWSDPQGVALAAERLGLSEFEFFCAAFSAWFDEQACERTLEHHFVRYLFAGVAPFWVRHFAREVLRAPRGQRRAARTDGAAPWPVLLVAPRLAFAVSADDAGVSI